MLTKIEVRTDRGDLLTLSLEDPSSGFIVADIDGLDPAKATIVSSDFAQLDGTRFQSSRRESRNIKIKIEPDLDYLLSTVQELRKQLYQFFMPKLNVKLRFYLTSGLIVEATGQVESFDWPLFTKDPEGTISIICFDSDLHELEATVISGSTSESMTPTGEFYAGSVQTGFIFELLLNRSESAFTIYQQLPNGHLHTLDFSAPLLSGDVLRISTIPGAKGAWLTRSDSQSSILYGVLPASEWLSLEPGVNELRFYATGAPIPFTLTYTNKYGGL